MKDKGQMKCSTLFGSLAAAVALFACYFHLLLDDHTKAVIKYEASTMVLGPLLQLGWKSGLLVPLLRHDYDGSGYSYPRHFMSQKHFDKVMKLKPEPGDIFIVTFPKSGTHFSGQLVLQVMYDGEAEFDNFNEMVAGLEFEGFDPEVNPACKGSKALGIHNFRESNAPKPAIVLTHLAAHHLPKSPDAKYIVMMRNPVDVLASGIKMMSKGLGPRLAPGVETFYEMMFGDDLNTWAQFNLDFWQKRNESNVLFLFYEDAVKDTKSTVERVAKFLGRALDPEAVEKVRYKSSIEYMKPNAIKFEPPKCLDLLPLKNPNRHLGMINKGQSGKGKLVVPEYMRELIKAKYLATFENTDFPIERYLNSI